MSNDQFSCVKRCIKRWFVGSMRGFFSISPSLCP